MPDAGNIADPVHAPDENGYVPGDINGSVGAPNSNPTDPPVPTPEQAAALAAEADNDPAVTIARLEREVRSARHEAATRRRNAEDAKDLAAEARAQLAQDIGKALGIVDPDAPPDPAELTAKIESSQAAAKQANTELAVWRAAAAANGDPVALLDSRAFLTKVANIDPADADGLAKAIADAVADNPKLAATAAPAPTTGMRPNPAQGQGSAQPLGIDAQIAAAESSGDLRAALQLKAAKQLSNATPVN